jgi:hypothetical protein
MRLIRTSAAGYAACCFHSGGSDLYQEARHRKGTEAERLCSLPSGVSHPLYERRPQ